MTNIPNHIGTFTDDESIRHKRLLPASIEQVWKYLTEPALLAKWLAGGSLDARLGGSIELNFDLIECPGREDVHGFIHGFVTEFLPPHRIAYTWDEGNGKTPASLVCFELEPVATGETLLTLTHTRIDAKELASIGAGWHVHINVLIDRLEGREPGHFMNDYYALEPVYKESMLTSITTVRFRT